MRGAQLYYNGIGIALTKTNSIDLRNHMTKDGVDYLFTEVTLNVDGIINPKEMSYEASVGGNSPVLTPNKLPGTTFKNIEAFLMENRGPLVFSNYLTNMFTIPDGSLNNVLSDVNNGPFPQSVRITRIDGGMTFHINYIIKIYLSLCTSYGNTSFAERAMLSNRFSQSETLDISFFRTVTTTGYAYFAVDVLQNSNLVADSFRSFLLPQIPYGFRRESVDFTVNTAGNQIGYSCVDKEWPYELGDTGSTGSRTYVTKVEGRYTQSTIAVNAEGAPVSLPTGMQLATTQVAIWGSKQADNWGLTQVVFAFIASGKMQFGNGVDFIKHISITQSLTDRYVEVTVVQQLQPSKQAEFGGFKTYPGLKRGEEDIWGNFGGVNPSLPGDLGTRSTQAFLLLSSSLKNACELPPTNPCNPLANVSKGGGVYCGPAATVSVKMGTILPIKRYNYSDKTIENTYTQSHTESTYDTNHGIYQSPKAGDGTSYVPGGGPQQSSSSIMTLTRPMTTRTVRWMAERINKSPQIPSMYSGDKDQVLMSSQINMKDIQILPDNSKVYTISGMYKYAFKKSIDDLNALPYDMNTWTDFDYGDDKIDLNNDQIDGLTGPAPN